MSKSEYVKRKRKRWCWRGEGIQLSLRTADGEWTGKEPDATLLAAVIFVEERHAGFLRLKERPVDLNCFSNDLSHRALPGRFGEYAGPSR